MPNPRLPPHDGLSFCRPEPLADAPGSVASNPELAAQLGLPSTYDPRFRLPASLLAPPERVGAAVRAIARRMAQRAAAAAGSSSRDHGRERERERERDRERGRDRDRDRDRGGGGSGGSITSEIMEAATQVGGMDQTEWVLRTAGTWQYMWWRDIDWWLGG